jgi:thiol-disulfide isomerase/thioredoxin
MFDIGQKYIKTNFLIVYLKKYFVFEVSKLLIVSFILINTILSSQVIYENDFENGFNGILLVDHDKRIPDVGVKEFTDAWTIHKIGNNKVATSNSWYNPPGRSDDWMILPAIEGIQDNTYLSWSAQAGDPTVKESYEVRISLFDKNLASFSTVLFMTKEQGNQTSVNLISLKQWKNKKIYIAFRNVSNDKYLLHIDDIRVFHAFNYDAEITNFSTEKYLPVDLASTLSMKLRNNGLQKIKDLKISYQYDGAVHSEEVSNLDLDFGESISIGLDKRIIRNKVAIDSIKIIDIIVNGVKDQYNLNNSNTSFLYGLSDAPLKNILMEYGTGTWCGFCPRSIVTSEEMQKLYGSRFIPIAIHNDDPMVLKEYDLWFNTHPDFIGYPSAILNRRDYTGIQDISSSVRDIFDKKWSPLSIISNVSIIQDSLDISLKLTSHTHLQKEKFKIFYVLTEDKVKGTTKGYDQVNNFAGGTFGLMGGFETKANPIPAKDIVYNNVARYISAVSGALLTLPSPFTSKDIYPLKHKIYIDSLWKISNLNLIVFITDDDLDIVSASKMKLSSVVTTYELAKEDDILIYPMPTSDKINFKIHSTSPLKIVLQDIYGRELQEWNLNISEYDDIDISNYNPGYYFLKFYYENQKPIFKKVLKI